MKTIQFFHGTKQVADIAGDVWIDNFNRVPVAGDIIVLTEGVYIVNNVIFNATTRSITVHFNEKIYL